MQLMMEQMVLFQKNRFGRSSEKMADSEQIRLSLIHIYLKAGETFQAGYTITIGE